MDDLRVSIESHNDIFESLLRLIPSKYYLVKDDNTDVSTITYHSYYRRTLKSTVLIDIE